MQGISFLTSYETESKSYRFANKKVIPTEKKVVVIVIIKVSFVNIR